MACKNGTFEYMGECVSPNDFIDQSKKSTSTTQKKPKNPNSGGFFLDLLKTLGAIAPGVILATKGKESGVPQWDTAYTTDQNTEGGDKNQTLKLQSEGLPMWVWIAFGIGGLGLVIFLIKSLSNRKA